MTDPYHNIFAKFVADVNAMNNPTILEIGSRNVSGHVRKDLFLASCEYIGFDIHPGKNVDVIGDAHKLSSHFDSNKFDAIFSISVFEHLLMPWKTILEINKVLKMNGLVFISTHPTWPSHELPWDFWRFQKNSFHGLFNKYTGFKIIELIEGLPCKVVSLVSDAPTVNLEFEPANLGVGVIAKKVADPNKNLHWDVNIEDIIDTTYPFC